MISIKKIGFMQGRLVSPLRNKTQSYPLNSWKKEFDLASKIKIYLMEWTIDSYKFFENALIDENQHSIIKNLKYKFRVKINSVTADFFMEKYNLKNFRLKNNKYFNYFLKMCFLNKIKIIVIPMVDKCSINKSFNYVKRIIHKFNQLQPVLKKYKLKIAFEVDLNPKDCLYFINHFDKKYYGINYDIGNSIGNNFNYKDEINTYGKRIINVHIKNKKKNKTCDLLKGDGNIKRIIGFLKQNKYNKNYILQTARVKKNHFKKIKKYLDIIKKF
jgi:L-ribulose-5-phosphate 3-epimerase